jgi:PAS domain-containing protein
MEDGTLNTTEINSDFYKLQDYNSLNELFQTIITKNQINENHIDDINQQLTTSLENMSDGFVAINEKWEYTFVNQKLRCSLIKT